VRPRTPPPGAATRRRPRRWPLSVRVFCALGNSDSERRARSLGSAQAGGTAARPGARAATGGARTAGTEAHRRRRRSFQVGRQRGGPSSIRSAALEPSVSSVPHRLPLALNLGLNDGPHAHAAAHGGTGMLTYFHLLSFGIFQH
jgi:hypothetical protein